MSVDDKIVRRIAHLARLKLEEAEVAPMTSALNGILGWVEQLQEVNTEGVAPMASVIGHTMRWRDDVVNDPPLTGGDRQADVLANAPEAQFGFFAVPKVIE